MQRSLTFLFVLFGTALQPASAQRAPLPEVARSGVEYADVASARKALDGRDDVVTRNDNGWHIVIDRGSRTIWSFAPPDYPAYPAVVKRQVVPAGKPLSFLRSGSVVKTSVKCEASKQACDNLVIEFQQMLERGFSKQH